MIVPDPLILTVPVLVKLANAVVLVAVPLIANVPPLVLVVTEHDPPVILTAPEVFDKVPVPVKDVDELIVPVLVRVTPVMVSIVALVNVPLLV